MRRTTVILIIILNAFMSAQAHGLAHAQKGGVVSRPRSERARRLRASDAGAFVERVRAGDARAVRRMLARGADPNSKSAKGAPAMVIAARAGSAGLMRALLDAGANVNADDSNHYTALHYAAQSGNLSLVELLLGRGANVNKPGYDDHTVLIFAMQGASLSRMPGLLLELMLRYEKDEGDDGITPRHLGKIEDYRRVTARLIEAGAEVNIVADCGETALMAASCDAALTKMLLAEGARVDYGLSSPLCLIADGDGEKVGAAYLGELGDGLSASRRRALARALRRWWVEAALQRHEVERLLVAAGADRRGCGEGEP